MFDFSTPQQRERLLVIAAGFILFVIVMTVIPSLFKEMSNLQAKRDNLKKEIAEYDRHAKNKTDIHNRLTNIANQSLSVKEESVSEYERWLSDIFRASGLTHYSSGPPQTTGQKNAAYKKYTFSLTGTGKAEQIAEFMRRFQKSEFTHLIQTVSHGSVKSNGEMDVTFKIETLSLPQVKSAKIPSARESASAADKEKQMLANIKNRSLFSEYSPPRPPAPAPPLVVNPPPPPPPRLINEFDDTPYCYVTAVFEVDGALKCWVDHRTAGKIYRLMEGEFFYLGKVRCTVKKIDIDARAVQFEAAGGLYTIRLGKSFAEFD